MALPILNAIKIERHNFVDLAGRLYLLVKDTLVLSNDVPKNYYYSQFLLDQFIKEQNLKIAQSSNAANREDEAARLK